MKDYQSEEEYNEAMQAEEDAARSAAEAEAAGAEAEAMAQID